MDDGHHHHHHPHEDETAEAQPHLDLAIPDRELRPVDLTRRKFLQRVGLLGAAAAAVYAGAIPIGAAAQGGNNGGNNQDDGGDPDNLIWLAGDHHTHTQYSVDARYMVSNHVAAARKHGLDWLVITDHGRVAHEKVSIDRTFKDVVQARAANPQTLVYQGLEWNIPAAEHGTIFFAPGANETEILHYFEKNFDGVVVYGSKATSNDPAIEAKAIEAIKWMEGQVTGRRTSSALFLANHPARRGLDSPHEFRAWNNASPRIAVGMEGAPGHQASGMARSAMGPEAARGFYDFAPVADSFTGYPLESYRTFGGFDWITAKVGGLWDSLLAEGRRFYITANSDSHAVYRDTLIRGAGDGQYDNPASPYYGAYGNPVDTGVAQAGNGDFWPGFYSRTVVGARGRDYVSVMDAIRGGRMWVCHGDLISGLDVRVLGDDSPATLGGTAYVQAGDAAKLVVRIKLPAQPNFNGDMPHLRRVDLIAGPITGHGSDSDGMAAPGTRVIRSWDIESGDVERSGDSQDIVLNHQFDKVREPFYLRLRGTDGNVSAPGSIEPRLDPVPVDPWTDLWFYANPVFVEIKQ